LNLSAPFCISLGSANFQDNNYNTANSPLNFANTNIEPTLNFGTPVAQQTLFTIGSADKS